MKLLLGLAVLSLSFSSFASETARFLFDGTQTSTSFSLNAEKTHAVFKTEDVLSTCYDREISGYRTSCISGNYRPYPNGYPGNFPGGYYDPRNRYPQPGVNFPGSGTCVEEPIYRSKPYSCLKPITTVVQVKEYDVEAKVNFKVLNSTALKAKEDFTVTLIGDVIKVTVKGSKNFLVVLKKPLIKNTFNGAVKYMEAELEVELIEAQTLFKALKSYELSLTSGILNFAIGPEFSPDNFAFSLNVLKKRFGADRIVFDRDLVTSELNLQDGALVSVDLSRLKIEFSGGKYDVTGKVTFKPEGILINRSIFTDDSLSSSSTVKYSH